LGVEAAALSFFALSVERRASRPSGGITAAGGLGRGDHPDLLARIFTNVWGGAPIFRVFFLTAASMVISNPKLRSKIKILLGGCKLLCA
jgi:hypothetical protein